MLLYGSSYKNIELLSDSGMGTILPQFWSREKKPILMRPHVEDFNGAWGELEIDTHDFYILRMNYREDAHMIMDLRRDDWRWKLCTFITWYGSGWSTAGGLWKDLSPLTHLVNGSNFAVLMEKGYLWVAFYHKIREEDEPLELWYYLDFMSNTIGGYRIKKRSYEEFSK